MAKQGFYDIKTIECLNREYEVKKIGFRAIADYESEKSLVANKSDDTNKREKKAFEKEQQITCVPLEEMRGHTGYLTFAIKF